MKIIAALLFILVASASTQAQFNLSTRKSNNNRGDSENSSSFFDKLYFSGGGNFGSGTNPGGFRYNYYSLFPTVGYKITDEFMLGLNFSYTKYNFPDIGASYNQTGYAPFARYYIQQLFVQLEYATIKSSTLDVSQPTKSYDRLLAGLGYRLPMGKRSAMNVLFMYDLLYQSSGPFLSPLVYRIFFSY